MLISSSVGPRGRTKGQTKKLKSCGGIVYTRMEQMEDHSDLGLPKSNHFTLETPSPSIM